MSSEPAGIEPNSLWRRWVGVAIIKAARLAVAGLIFGLAYNWAAPVLYRPEANPGFWVGCAHGALMPVALPNLLVGSDVPIYATKNQGRKYKLGYIAGINACGLVFFGLAFWSPKRARENR